STVYVPRKELHLRQALEESTALVLAQSMDPAGLADRQLVHQPAGLDLADTGQRLQHGHDLHLPDNLVAIALLEQLSERDRAHLQLLLQLRALPASGGGLLEGGLALIRRKRGGQRHGDDPSAPCPPRRQAADGAPAGGRRPLRRPPWPGRRRRSRAGPRPADPPPRRARSGEWRAAPGRPPPRRPAGCRGPRR